MEPYYITTKRALTGDKELSNIYSGEMAQIQLMWEKGVGARFIAKSIRILDSGRFVLIAESKCVSFWDKRSNMNPYMNYRVLKFAICVGGFGRFAQLI